MLKRSYLLIQQYPVAKQVVRFGFVGGSATIVNYLMVVALVSTLHMKPLIANIFACMVACQVSFYGHKYWTFEHDAAHLPALSKFIILTLFGFALNESLFAFFLHALHLHYQLALFFVLLIVPPITFVCNKFWVFR